MTQDLMIPPEDSLVPTTNETPLETNPSPVEKTEDDSFVPPASWGSDMSLHPANPSPAEKSPEQDPLHPSYPWLTAPAQIPPIPPQLQSTSLSQENLTTPINPPQNREIFLSLPRIILIGLVLLLSGVLLGILANKQFPSPTPSSAPKQPEAEIPISDTISVIPSVDQASPTPSAAPTATPSALLNLKWNMLTIKSPVSSITPYRLYYPSSWYIREYKNTLQVDGSGLYTLSLAKGKSTINLSSNASYTCDKPVAYSFDKESVEWIIQEASASSLYQLCETGNGAEPPFHIGSATLTGTNIESATLDEFKYILEKITIIK